MLRKQQNQGFTPGMSQGAPYKPVAGMPDYNAEYRPQNMYDNPSLNPGHNTLDVTDIHSKMRPDQIPVPGTSVWSNPNSSMGNLDMLGMLSSMDTKQRSQVNPLELYACQNEGPSVLHPEVQPIYEGCRRLILNGKQDVGFCQYKNKIINFGRLFLDKDHYEFPFPFTGYKQNEIAVMVIKYRAPNILLALEPHIEFNDQVFTIGQFAHSAVVVHNYFYIAWAYMHKDFDQIHDFKA